MTEEYISEQHKAMFEELMRAARNNALVLVACSGELNPGKRYAVLCAVQPEENENISLIPFARLLDRSEVDWMKPILVLDHKKQEPGEEEENEI
tara:strand:- start:945 stop:1226 length:282 start_codon:yes stop_codon:yes gene_type:complete